MRIFSLFTFFSLIYFCSSAQLSFPPSGDNQKSVVTQYMGAVAHVTITYNSPDVTAGDGTSRKGKIWGNVIPWGLADNSFGTAKKIPWRVGANENTTIEFSHPMMVQGKEIPAGKYGFHIIPQEEGEWTLIFSSSNQAWGSYFYKASEDVLRVTTTPKPTQYTEWMTFEFVDRQADQTTVALKWDELMIPFTIAVPNNHELHMNVIRDELRSDKGFDKMMWVYAAQMAAKDSATRLEALEWADFAVNAPFVGEKNFTTMSTKANILDQLGRQMEATQVMDEALELPTTTAFQIHQYGQQLIGQGDKQEALRIFKLNHKKFDGAWPTTVGMMRGLSAMGNYKEAMIYANEAFNQAPDQANKDNIQRMIDKLKQGKDVN